MSDLLPSQTVPVRIINGVFVPCRSCHYYSSCIVPRSKYNPKSESFAIREYYQCEDYIPNKPPR